MRPNLITVTLSSLILSALIFLIVLYNNYFLIQIDLETSKSIIGTIITAAGAFIGFIVIYLSISFESFKKNYGQYAPRFFARDKLVWSLIVIFILIILSGLLSFLLADSKTLFSVWIFNMTCFYFSMAVVLLIPYGYKIIQNPTFRIYVEQLINDLTDKDFLNTGTQSTDNKTIFQIANQSDDNKINVIRNILYNSIQEKNTTNSISIIIHLYSKLEKILKDEEVSIDSKLRVTSSFMNIVQTSFARFNANSDSLGIKTAIATTNSFNKIIAENKFNERFIKNISETIEFITRSLIEVENETLVSDSLWAYYHMIQDQLTMNIGIENDIWEEIEPGWFMPKNTPYAIEQDRKFDAIDEFSTFKLNEVIDRVFLCKNYHLIGDSINIYSSLAEMIIYNSFLGEIQKDKIGSSFVYYSYEAIKRYITNGYPKKLNYLNFYLGNTHILHLLEQNSKFSKSVFSTFIELVDFLIDADKFDLSELEKLTGLCRLIIAYSPKILEASNFVEQILKLQKKLKIKYLQEIVTSRRQEQESNKANKIVSQIQKDMSTYLAGMNRKNIINEELKEVLEKYK